METQAHQCDVAEAEGVMGDAFLRPCVLRDYNRADNVAAAPHLRAAMNAGTLALCPDCRRWLCEVKIPIFASWIQAKDPTKAYLESVQVLLGRDPTAVRDQYPLTYSYLTAPIGRGHHVCP